MICLDAVDSTNTYLKKAAASLPDLAAVTAEEQLQGRGRLGRNWQSRPGQSLALSVLFKSLPGAAVGRMPIVCAVAAAQAVRRVSGAECGIKWPNDIVWHSQKLIGILCESTPLGEGRAVVCGFGLNLTQTPEQFRKDGLPYAVSLKTIAGCEISREAAAASLCAALGETLRREAGDILREYRQKCVNIGKPVFYTRGEKEAGGLCVGISDGGGLLVEAGGKTVELCSGEVSVKGFYGING